MRPHTETARTFEAAQALGLGLGANLALTIAAQAGVVAGVPAAHEWPAAAGAMGGLVAALVHVAAIGLSADAPSRRDVVRAVVEGVFSVIVGGVSAGYLTVQVARVANMTDPADRLAVGFAVGVFAWRAAPGFIGLARGLASPKASLRAFVVRWLGLDAPGPAPVPAPVPGPAPSPEERTL